MNRNKLKTYAPAARRDFLQAVKDRATHYGLSAKKIEPMTERGDVVLIAGQPFPKSVAAKRKMLEQRIERDGYDRTIEAAAYTWFNRFVAIRFMELHGYLDHGYRVLSHPGGGVQPEILDHAQRVDFPGLEKAKVLELKLDGTKQEELYRLLLVAQCNALNKAMPFLFEKIEDETELLLPANLLATDSLIRKLVEEVDEADWQEVEILGWLYQFYISERKDEVIGKVVASEDIPAATQLFTPNWIVKYLVQNTLGRIWLATYPQSAIRQQMEFYIEPAEQTPEVQEQLKAITPTSLNPEELTLLDPACGSAHILVEAYDLFKAIYQERGYRAKDIPGLILQKNLFGLEIDDRAAQLAAFALLMKARADDRRILEAGIQPNILAFVESKGMDAEAITEALNSPISGGAEGTVSQAEIAALLELFAEAKTFGSLIEMPEYLTDNLRAIADRLVEVLRNGNLIHAQAATCAPLIKQGGMLARNYDVVVANPPYMGSKYHPVGLKSLLSEYYPAVKADLFSAFIVRCAHFTAAKRFFGLMSPNVWMYIASHERLREILSSTYAMQNLIELPLSGFKGATVQICCFTALAAQVRDCASRWVRLVDCRGGDEELSSLTIEAIRNPQCGWHFVAQPAVFAAIPGKPFAYWASRRLLDIFAETQNLESVAPTRKGMVTARNHLFVRAWSEVSVARCAFDRQGDRSAARVSGLKWFSYVKGGGFRKWAGNKTDLVNWENDGHALQSTRHPTEDRVWATNFNLEFIFKPNVNWGAVTSSDFSARLSAGGELFDAGGSACFPREVSSLFVLSFLNSHVTQACLQTLNPTLNFQAGNISSLPLLVGLDSERVRQRAARLVQISEADWNSHERSWNFCTSPLLERASGMPGVASSFAEWATHSRSLIAEMKRLEEENNQQFIDAYGLAEGLQSHVSIDCVSLVVNPAYRYGIQLTDREWSVELGFGRELDQRFRQDTVEEMLSYAVGCMMGRYSLDKEGLIYAHSANEGFDPSQYTKFPADDDGIVPVTESAWFEDDAANRFERFVKTVWPVETLEENLSFVAESLGSKKSETAREAIRRFFAGDFYKHHLQTYKNRPIYWLFTSGKQGAFEALVYLHRYNEGTLSRMRTEYVVPLLGKISGRIGMLADTISSATSTKHRKDAEKEKDRLTKQQAELQAFDEKLRHYADQRISLDLDDGVKVNYGKFGDLLADVKKVCGTKEED